jgi:hypothetical protein
MRQCGEPECSTILQFAITAGLPRHPRYEAIQADITKLCRVQYKPEGKSIFNNVENMSNVLTNTQVYEITDSELPEGLGLIADGKEAGGHTSKGHHTVYPTRDMPFDEFSGRVSSLGTEHIGKIDKDGKFKPECP